MGDVGFFKGTTHEQDSRFSNKQKKLMKQMKFDPVLNKKVDMDCVKMENIKPWVSIKITELLGFEDDVIIDFILNQLDEKNPDGKTIQINLTGFLNAKNAQKFVQNLWTLLLNAMEENNDIPEKLIESKMKEIKQELDEIQPKSPENEKSLKFSHAHRRSRSKAPSPSSVEMQQFSEKPNRKTKSRNGHDDRQKSLKKHKSRHYSSSEESRREKSKKSRKHRQQSSDSDVESSHKKQKRFHKRSPSISESHSASDNNSIKSTSESEYDSKRRHLNKRKSKKHEKSSRRHHRKSSSSSERHRNNSNSESSDFERRKRRLRKEAIKSMKSKRRR